MKAGTQNHVKTKRLKRILKIPLYRVVGILETIWLLCLDCCDEGNIGKFTDDEIADYLEWDGKPSELVRGLADSGWTDTDAAGRPVIHDWLDHCPEYIRERVRKRYARAAKANKQTTYDASTPDNSGTGSDLSGFVPSIPNPTQPNQLQPNPSPPSDAADAAGTAATVSWESVLEALRQAGVRETASAVRDAKKARLPPQEALAIVRHFTAHPGAWSPGMVLTRFRQALPGEPASDGWPSPATEYTEKVKANGKARLRDFSERIDSLSEALLVEIMGKEAPPFIRERYKLAGREDGVVREFLAEHLAKGPAR